MPNDPFRKLQEVLDTLPNGFPKTDDGLEIRILKKIFTEEDALLFCDLRLSFETAEQIAERTERPLDGLLERLKIMWERGQIFGVDFSGTHVFRMAPWIFGIYEFQLKHLDRELAELCKAYEPWFAPQFFQQKPALMHVVPIEEEVESENHPLPFDKVSSIIEKGKAFGVADCICKKEHEILDMPCTKPLEVCLSIAPIEGFFDNHPLKIRPISKEEAYKILKMSEEAGLVHMTNNFEKGHFFICNCCGCCCGVLRAINEYGITNAIHTNYVAEIDPDACVSCGICAETRCQVHAIEEGDEGFSVIKERCIGCGLCISTCPSDAVRLVKKAPDKTEETPKNESDWYSKRAEVRGVDYSRYA